MYRHETVKKKLLSFLLMIAMVVTMMPVGIIASTADAQAATTYTYEAHRIYCEAPSGAVWRTTRFSVPSMNARGVCCHAGKPSDLNGGKTTVKKLGQSSRIAKVAYYYVVKKKIEYNGWDAMKLARAFSRLNGAPCKPFSEESIDKYIDTAIDYVDDHMGGTVPTTFECYFCNPTNTGAQEFVVWKIIPKGKLTLKKTSTDSKSIGVAPYTFKGIEYTVYDEKGVKQGVLTCKADGTTNTLSLAPGKYTVKETKTNEFYEKNTKVYPATVKSSATVTVSAKDDPVTASVKIQKKMTGNNENVSLAFDFTLVNTKNSKVSYKATTDAKTGEATIDSMIAGTYVINEVLPPDGTKFVNVTGVENVTVDLGESETVEWINDNPKYQQLRVSKTTDDGSVVEGFKFKITGILYNEGVMTEKAVLDTVKPSIDAGSYDSNVYELGEWTVDKASLDALNKHAAEDRNGGSKYEVLLKNKLSAKSHPEDSAKNVNDYIPSVKDKPLKGTITENSIVKDGDNYYRAKKDAEFDVSYVQEDDLLTGGKVDKEPAEIDEAATAANIKALLSGSDFEKVQISSDIDIEVKATVNLKNTEFVYNEAAPETSAYEKNLSKQIKNPEEKTVQKRLPSGAMYTVTYNNFDWYGAATKYQEIDKDGNLTGKNYSILVTKAGGLTDMITFGICAGEFTCEEQLTDEQKSLYREPEKPQVIKVDGQDEVAIFTFNVENKALRVPVKVKKACKDGNIEGIAFKLEGKNVKGEDVSQEGITDENGEIDFGYQYAGDYVVSETGFDKEEYRNTYKLDGYDVPAQKLSVTPEDIANNTVKELTFEFTNVPLANLLLTKIDSESKLFLDGATFELIKDGKQIATFKITRDEEIQSVKAEFITLEDPELIAGSYTAAAADTDDDADVDTGDGENAGGDDATVDEDLNTAENDMAVIKGLEEGKTYTIKELTSPEGYFEKAEKTFEFSDGDKVVLENTHPELSTTAIDKETGEHISNADGSITIIDTVAYKHLEKGKKYRADGQLVIKEDTENAVEGDEVTAALDAKGNPITASKEFVAEESDGTVDVEFTFDGSNLAGKSIVAFETLVEPSLLAGGEEEPVAQHADLDDEDQTIWLPEVKTTATDKENGSHLSNADEDITITDLVKYKNVVPGKEYTVTGVLMDKKTGEPVLINGEKVTATKTFTPEKANGEVELEFTFDGSKLENTTVVAFETLEVGGKEVGVHADIEDEDQTVRIPEVRTTATEKNTKMHIAPSTGEATVVDVVKYKNVIPGQKYTVKGVLMNKDTGEAFTIDGKEITASKTITPDKADGEVELEFTFDANKLGNTTLVVFEKLLDANDFVVGHHEDINDEDQTVHLSDIKTTAKGKDTKQHMVNAAGKQTIVDTVSYKNLEAGQTYRIEGRLMFKPETENEEATPVTDANGKEITASKTFKATKASGEETLEFTFDASLLDGKKTVVFEKIYVPSLIGEDTLIGSHEDPSDEDQSVYFPEVKTTATAADTNDHITLADNKVSITDTVKYSNVIEGNIYTVNGTLMDKKTGEPVLVNGKKVTATKSFKATADGPVEVTGGSGAAPAPEKVNLVSGEVELTFTFDGRALAGTTAVVYEDLL